MEENMDKQQGMNNCYCGCHNGHFRGHYLLRWFLGLVILMLVFCLGMAVGRFKSEFGSHSHYRGFGGRQNMMYYGNPGAPYGGMMGTFYQTVPTTTPIKK